MRVVGPQPMRVTHIDSPHVCRARVGPPSRRHVHKPTAVSRAHRSPAVVFRWPTGHGGGGARAAGAVAGGQCGGGGVPGPAGSGGEDHGRHRPQHPAEGWPGPPSQSPPTHLATWPAKTHSTLQLTVIFTAADDHLPATYCCGGGFVYGCVVFVVVVVVVVVCACGCIWVSSLFFFATAWISLASFLALFLHHYPMGVGVNSAGHSLIH